MQTKSRSLPSPELIWRSRDFLPGTFRKHTTFRFRECWLWKEGEKPGKHQSPQRWSWKLHRGHLDPKSELVTTCGNPLCVNPSHLALKRPG